MAEALRCEAAVSWEEVAIHLAEGKMAALGARLAELRVRAVELGVARPKLLGRGAQEGAVTDPAKEQAELPGRLPDGPEPILAQPTRAEHPLQVAINAAVAEAVKAALSAEMAAPKRNGSSSTTPKFMKVAAYAQHRDLSKRTIENLIKQGLPVDGRGKLRRVPVAAADLWMREHGHEALDRRAERSARRAAQRAAGKTTSGKKGGS